MNPRNTWPLDALKRAFCQSLALAAGMVLLLGGDAPAAADAESKSGDASFTAVEDTDSGQIIIRQRGRLVLRYNYRTVEPPKGFLDEVKTKGRKYAQARSDYIHPLYGPEGEELTKDWSVDHPHHRGIYWAWPEVSYRGELGDLHALQQLFARPTGKIELRQGDGFSEIEAENEWRWDDKTPIVRETATIRAHKAGTHGRYVDMQFEFTALTDGVTLARRKTKTYGGLNIRLAPVTGLKLAHHADPAGASPRRAWQLAAGTWKGAKSPASLVVFENAGNPQYPGQYVKYLKLPWFQPTFPRSGTRYTLVKGKPLTLRYRLWIHSGGVPEAVEQIEQWNLYNVPYAQESKK